MTVTLAQNDSNIDLQIGFCRLDNLVRTQQSQSLYRAEHIAIMADQPLPSDRSNPVTSVGQLVSIPEIDAEILEKDKQWVSNTNQGRLLSRMQRMGPLLDSQVYQEWYNSETSSILLINAMEHTWPAEVPSTTGYTISETARSLLESGEAIPLVFFCGRHKQSNDPLEGPSGLLRSLNDQLLAQASVQRSDLFWDKNHREAIREGQVQSLDTLFGHLLKSVIEKLEKPIFCLIEDISSFDNVLQGYETGLVLNGLKEKVKSTELKHPLRVLVTSRTSVGTYKPTDPPTSFRHYLRDVPAISLLRT